MPLTPAEIAQLDAVLIRIVRQDIGTELAEYYGAAVFYSDNVKPEQPNNEIRNALNHLARAYDASTWAEAQADIAAAERHVLRAKRDALKLAVIGLFSQAREILQSARYFYGAIPPPLLVRRSELTERRREVYARESSGHRGATALLLGIFVDASRFLLDLQNEFPAATPGRRFRILLLRVGRQVTALAVGFLLGVLGSLCAAALWEHYHQPTAPDAGHAQVHSRAKLN